MTSRIKDVLKLCQSWSPEERADLAALLLDGLEEDLEFDATSAWDLEIARRVDELEKGQVKCLPSKEVHQQMQEVIDAYRVSSARAQ